MKILLSGGGTLGPVTPLLALVEYWRAKEQQVDLVWVGTKQGPERALVESYDLRFLPMTSVKFPRYASFYWIAMPYKLVRACVDARRLLKQEHPDLIVSAGGYVSVPLVVIGRLMKIRSWVHQQDVLPGLANKLMARFATRVSVTFEASRDAFPTNKTETTGNPVRPSFLEPTREAAYQRFGLDPSRKTLLVFGGGGGSAWLNTQVARIAGELTKTWQVLHVTGAASSDLPEQEMPYYHVTDLVGRDFALAYAAADVVLCRAGMGTMTELAHVGKPAIVVPIPGSHQEMNAFYLYEHQAAVVLDQTETTPQMLWTAIRTLMEDMDAQLRLTANLKLSFPKDGTAHVANGIIELAKEAENEWQSTHEEVAAEPSEEDAATVVVAERLTVQEPAALEDGADVVVIDEEVIAELDRAHELDRSDLSIQDRIARAMGRDAASDEDDGEEDLFHVTRL